MSPQYRDTNVRPLGPCSICGFEKIQFTRITTSIVGGVQLKVSERTNCGCGEVELPPDPENAL